MDHSMRGRSSLEQVIGGSTATQIQEAGLTIRKQFEHYCPDCNGTRRRKNSEATEWVVYLDEPCPRCVVLENA